MVQQSLTPGVEHGQESDLGAEMLGISGDAAECLSRRTEEYVVDDSLVLQGYRRYLVRDGEHHVKVVDRQELGLTLGKPSIALQ